MNNSIKLKFRELKRNVDSLEYSPDSIVELGALKIEAERISMQIDGSSERKFCLNELNEIGLDEFLEMYSKKSEVSFVKAKNEFSYILNDCANGGLFK